MTESTAPTACPTDLELEALLCGDATEEGLAQLHDHSAQCTSCRVVLASIARVRVADNARRDGSPGPTTGVGGVTKHSDGLGYAGTELFAGSKIGRFVVERELGRGGMGVVFAARDETLHRSVAVKVLDTLGASPGAAILAEARAMAAVDHPNVVSVYEVSVVGEQVYLVMDLVDGPNLAEWLANADPDWRRTVAMFLDAARGLEAIHRAGLVHRDFKPHNVLVSATGRAHVTDFGLVRPAPAAAPQALSPDAPARDTVTTVGRVKGTPRYMAPEQLRGRPLTAKADQFSFAASLYEALTTVVPFRGATSADRLRAIEAGVLAKPPPHCMAPQAMLSIVARALRADPSRRFATIGQLASALRRVLERRRRVVVAAVASSLALGAAGLGLALGSSSRDDPCADRGDGLGDTWDAERRRTLGASMRAVHPNPLQVRRGLDALDRYATAWRDSDAEACQAAFVHRDVSDTLYDRMMACLDDRRIALRATVEVLVAHADTTARDAQRIVAALPQPKRCLVPERLVGGQALPIDPGQREAIAEIRAGLATVEALGLGAQPAKARQAMDALTPALAKTDWAPIRAEAAAVNAEVMMSEGRHSEALVAWRRAYGLAFAGAPPELSTKIAVNGVSILLRANQVDKAAFLLANTQAQIEATQTDEFAALIESHLAALAYKRQDNASAEAHLRRLVELAKQDDSQPQLYPRSCVGLAGVLFATGRVSEALRWSSRAVAAWTERYGADHRQALESTINHGLYLTHAEHFDEAQATLTSALELAHAEGFRLLEARAAVVLADTLRGMEKYDEAATVDRRAREIYESDLPASDGRIAEVSGFIGVDLLEGGHPAEAITELRRAAAEVHYDPQVPTGFAPSVNGVLARALAATGDFEAAVATLRATQEGIERAPTLTPEHWMLLDFSADAAEVYELAGDFEAMLSFAERASAIAEGRDIAAGHSDELAALVRRARGHGLPAAVTPSAG